MLLSRVKWTLLGLKENVIIGKLIPAGTGMSRYRNIKVKSSIQEENEANTEEVSDNDQADVENGVPEERGTLTDTGTN